MAAQDFTKRPVADTFVRTLIDMQARIAELERQIISLQTRVTQLEQGP